MIKNQKNIQLKNKQKNFFLDEYTSEVFLDKDFIIPIIEHKKITFDEVFIRKKIKSLRKKLTKILNHIHNVVEKESYWGRIIDPYLIFIIKKIYFEKKILKKVDNKKYDLTLPNKINLNFNTQELLQSLNYNYETINYFRYLLFYKKKIDKENIQHLYEKSNTKILGYFKKFCTKLFNLYVKFFKPIILVDVYMSFFSRFLLLLNSRGNILCIKNNLLKPNYKISNQDQIKRKIIKITEEDEFDKIFNLVNEVFFPISLLEDFNIVKNHISYYVDKIEKIGTSVTHTYSDFYNILAAELKKKESKTFTFQHGVFYEEETLNNCKFLDNHYSDRQFLWKEKNGSFRLFISSVLSEKKSFNKKNKINILLFPTIIRLIPNSHKIKINSHPHLNLMIKLISELNEENKKNFRIKFFPQKFNSAALKSYKRYFKNFTEEKSHSSIYQADIVVLNDFSTPIAELFYINKPFIILYEGNYNFMNEKFDSYLKSMKKFGIIYQNTNEAANFLSQKKDKIINWWKKINSDQEIKKLKENLFFSDHISFKEIVHEIKKT